MEVKLKEKEEEFEGVEDEEEVEELRVKWSM